MTYAFIFWQYTMFFIFVYVYYIMHTDLYYQRLFYLQKSIDILWQCNIVPISYVYGILNRSNWLDYRPIGDQYHLVFFSVIIPIPTYKSNNKCIGNSYGFLHIHEFFLYILLINTIILLIYGSFIVFSYKKVSVWESYRCLIH